MNVKHICSKNFDMNFTELLISKEKKNVIRGRFDITMVALDRKIKFILQLLSSFEIIEVTYKILFWEQTEVVESFCQPYFGNKKYEISTSYSNKELPGVLYLEDDAINKIFLSVLLKNHFNYEMGELPALNIRVQICISQKDTSILLDIYDDRGFDVYYIPNSTLFCVLS
jgi:hypothetical protein